MRSALKAVVTVLRHRLFSGAVVLLLGLLGAHYYLGVVGKLYPVDDWLFWSLAKLWMFVAWLSVGCVAVGNLVLERLLRLTLNPLESLVQSMCVGLVTFVMLMYVSGALRLYGPALAVLLPLGMLLVGAPSFLRLMRRCWLAIREPRPANPFVWLVSGLGACCVGLAYLGILSPDSLNYDSTWSHLVIAQDYARTGRIIKYYGNYNMGVPHLASIVQTYSFSVPGLEKPVLRWMMALHLEFSLFCWTLVGVAAGVRRLIGEPTLRGTWAGFFLFPIIFVYDNNMGGAADHVAAFFVVPLMLATLEVWERFDWRGAALLAITIAGPVLTKYQALYLCVPIAGLLALRWTTLAYRLWRGRSKDSAPVVTGRTLWLVPLTLVGLGALLVSPHFIKNAIFYNNPVYPFAQDVFTASSPRSPNAGVLLRYYFTDDSWRPKGSTWDKLKHAAELCLTFSFEPHYSFTKNVPAFGSLFTLLLPALVVLRGAGRVWLSAVLAGGALFIWAYTYNIDRNLQIFLPLLVCVTVSLLILCWRLGWLARAGLIPLVAVQLIWGGDALFYSSVDRLQNAFRLIKSGYDGTATRRFDGYRSQFLALNAALPPDARVLLHTSHTTLGIEREVVMDWDAFQGFISYDDLSTVRELWDYLHARGITHLLLEPRARAAPSKQEEVLFNDLVSRYAEPIGSYGWYKLYRFPSQPPPASSPYRVVTLGLGAYQDGLYPIKRLNTHEYLPAYVKHYATPEQPIARHAAAAPLISVADAVIVATGARLDAAAQKALDERFSQVIRYDGYFSVFVAGKGRSSL